MSKLRKIIDEGYLKRNVVFIFIAFILLFSVIKGKVTLPMPLVSMPDSQVSFTPEQKVLEQTWQSNVKEIMAISVDFVSESDFQAEMELKIFSNTNELLASSITSASFQKEQSGTMVFPLESIAVEPGVRYRIQISYQDSSSEDGIILLPSGTNYGGCYVDGEAYNEAVNFIVSFSKASRISWLILTFFPFLSFSLLGMILWRRKAEETIGLSFIFVTLLLYISGLLDKLETGIFVIYLLAMLSFCFSIYLFNKKKMQFRELLSFGLIAYAVILVFVLLNCKDAYLARWDEYSHWGIAVKDMFYYNSFAKHINSTVLAIRYLPFSTLIEYFFTYTNLLFSCDLLYVGFQTTLLSTLIILCKSATKKPLYLFPMVSIIIFIPILFFEDAFNSIYVDVMMASLVAYVLICYYSEKTSLFNWLRIAGGLIALTLTKDMGLVLAGLLCILILVDTIYHKWKQKSLHWKETAIPVLCILLVLTSFLSWQIYLSIPISNIVNENGENIISDTEDIPADIAESSTEKVILTNTTIAASHISLQGLWDFLTLHGPAYQYQVVKNFVKIVFSEATYLFGTIAFSYIDLMIILIFLAGAIRYFFRNGNSGSRLLSLSILSFAMGVFYAGVLLIAYLFAFSQSEALLLSSHDRYLGAYICGVLIAFLGIFIMNISEENNADTFRNKCLVFFVSGLVLICAPVERLFVKNMDIEITKDEIYGYDTIEEAFRSFGERGESVYYVCNGSNGYAYYMFRNTISPLTTSSKGWNIYASEEDLLQTQNYMENKGTATIISVDKWKLMLNDFNYVFLFHPDESFKKGYSSLFIEPETINDGTIYMVNHNEDSIALDYIGSIGLKKFK